ICVRKCVRLRNRHDRSKPALANRPALAAGPGTTKRANFHSLGQDPGYNQLKIILVRSDKKTAHTFTDMSTQPVGRGPAGYAEIRIQAIAKINQGIVFKGIGRFLPLVNKAYHLAGGSRSYLSPVGFMDIA